MAEKCQARLQLPGHDYPEVWTFHCFLPPSHTGQHQGECIVHGFANFHAYWPIPAKKG